MPADDADGLLDQGWRHIDAGAYREAAGFLARAVDADPDLEPAWFGLGLAALHLRDWRTAAEANERACDLNGSREGEPSLRNLATAATAAGDWDTARRAWQRYGIDLPVGEGEIAFPMGSALMRLESGDVVWGERIDPARLRLVEIPPPDSGHRWGDVVLHWAAPFAHHEANGRVTPVFNELDRLDASSLPTLLVAIECDEEDVDSLRDAAVAAGLTAEDWTAPVRVSCRHAGERLTPGPAVSTVVGQARRLVAMAAPYDLGTAIVVAWVARRPAGRWADPPEQVA